MVVGPSNQDVAIDDHRSDGVGMALHLGHQQASADRVNLDVHTVTTDQNETFRVQIFLCWVVNYHTLLRLLVARKHQDLVAAHVPRQFVSDVQFRILNIVVKLSDFLVVNHVSQLRGDRAGS